MKKVTIATAMLFDHVIATFAFEGDITQDEIKKHVSNEVDALDKEIFNIIESHPMMRIMIGLTAETLIDEQGRIGKGVPIEVLISETNLITKPNLGTLTFEKPIDPSKN